MISYLSQCKRSIDSHSQSITNIILAVYFSLDCLGYSDA